VGKKERSEFKPAKDRTLEHRAVQRPVLQARNLKEEWRTHLFTLKATKGAFSKKAIH